MQATQRNKTRTDQWTRSRTLRLDVEQHRNRQLVDEREVGAAHREYRVPEHADVGEVELARKHEANPAPAERRRAHGTGVRARS